MGNLTPDAIKKDQFIKETTEKLHKHLLEGCSGCETCRQYKSYLKEAKEFVFYD